MAGVYRLMSYHVRFHTRFEILINTLGILPAIGAGAAQVRLYVMAFDEATFS